MKHIKPDLNQLESTYIWNMLILRWQENRAKAWCTSSSVGLVEKQNNKHFHSYGIQACSITVERTTRDRPPMGRMSCMTKSLLKSTSLTSSSSTREMTYSRPLKKKVKGVERVKIKRWISEHTCPWFAVKHPPPKCSAIAEEKVWTTLLAARVYNRSETSHMRTPK